MAPPPLRNRRVRLEASGMVVTAARTEVRPRPLCSIIVPAYNERDTFPLLLDALLDKQLPGMDKEVIVVESNSRDGTRELALRYAAHPEVTLILEDQPRGKGHAVRQGIMRARGDIVMIQDADLEYDLNDYEELIAPLLTHAVPFVLGGRHGGGLKMRQFTDQPLLAAMMNLGHVAFTSMLNLFYRRRMQDPFTMYKVFRRECLYGLEFECNRFDFDVELLSKLLRKGYDPVEIPVNYRARSFSEGKKVSVLRDPWTWLRAGFKYRLAPLRGPHERR
jgi:glycosyltransferase involved in cell wall biosynthesis